MTKVDAYRMLDSSSRIVLDTLLPPQAHPSLPYGLFEVGFESFYQDFTSNANRTLRIGFKLALFTAIWISPLLIWRFPPITRYSRQTRESALAAMETSRSYNMRQMITILKTVASFCYAANRNVRDAVGYPPQPGTLRSEDEEGMQQ